MKAVQVCSDCNHFHRDLIPIHSNIQSILWLGLKCVERPFIAPTLLHTNTVAIAYSL